jgi:hypothetical protein
MRAYRGRSTTGAGLSLCLLATVACGGARGGGNDGGGGTAGTAAFAGTSGSAGAGGTGQAGAGGAGGPAGSGGTAGPAGAGGRAGAAGDGGAGGSVDGGSPWAAGRVEVLQPEPFGAAILETHAAFAAIVPCTGPVNGAPGCACQDDVVMGCARRRCNGYFLGQTVSVSDLLGNGGVVDDTLATTAVDVGRLTIGDGTQVVARDAPYLPQSEVLPAAWATAQAISVEAPGRDVAGFSLTLPFPPRVTFEALPLPPFGDTIDLRWTPVAGTGTVEAISAYKLWPDAQYAFSVIRCTAPVSAGQLTLPLDGYVSRTTPIAERAIAVRVMNAIRMVTPGLQVDVVVASSASVVVDVPRGDGGVDEAGVP